MAANLQPLSILLELVIVFLGISIGLRKGKKYGFGLALTFFIYVLYDIIQAYQIDISTDILAMVFFIATISALISIWRIAAEKN